MNDVNRLLLAIELYYNQFKGTGKQQNQRRWTGVPQGKARVSHNTGKQDKRD